MQVEFPETSVRVTDTVVVGASFVWGEWASFWLGTWSDANVRDGATGKAESRIKFIAVVGAEDFNRPGGVTGPVPLRRWKSASGTVYP